MKFDLFLLLVAAGLLAVGSAAAVKDDSSSSSSSDDDDDDNDNDAATDIDDDDLLPSLSGMLGGKVAVADNFYDEYTDDDDDEQAVNKDASVSTTAAPTAPCCFPNVWQGRLKSDFGFIPIGGRGGGRDDNRKHHGGGGHGGRPIASHSIDQVYVDGANRRLAGRKVECHGRGRALNVSYIVLVGADRNADLYLFDPTAQKCRYRQLKGVDWRRQCIPANATLRGQYSLGPVAGGLSVQSWTFGAGSRRAENDEEDLWSVEEEEEAIPTTTTHHPRPRPRPRVFVRANVLVVPGSCTPVVIQEEGAVISGGRPHDNNYNEEDDSDDMDDNDIKRPEPRPKPQPRPRPKLRGEAFMGSVYFTGVQPRISDPSVFTPPSYCKKPATTLYYDEMEDEVPTILERFLTL